MTTRHVRRIDELARDIPPERDLWPAIAAAMAAERSESAPQAGDARRRHWWPAPALAAAVALVTLGVFIGRNLAPVAGMPVAELRGANAALMPAALRDADYRKQRDALLVEVSVRLETMPAAERAKVAASLATLRRSIGEIEAALGRDPANALLQDLLVSSCQEEMRALTAVRDAGSQET